MAIPFKDYVNSLDRSLLSESAQSIVTVCSAVNLMATRMAGLPAERAYEHAFALCRMYKACRTFFDEAFEELATGLRKRGPVKAFSATEFVVRYCSWIIAMRNTGFSPVLPDFTDLQMEIGLECKRALRELGLKAPKGSPGPADGPVPPKWLWWKGDRHELKPQIWRMMSVMWHEDIVRVDTFEESVWDENDEPGFGTIRPALSRANARLAVIGVPWKLSLQKGYIVKDFD
jgi:hypothetical protein